MTKLTVKNYSIYTPVIITRKTSGAIHTNAQGLGLITERPMTGRVFDTERMMNALIYGPDAKYFV